MVERNYLNDSHSSEKYAKYVMKSDPYSQSNNNGTMMQDLCLNARHCHTLGPRLLILVK